MVMEYFSVCTNLNETLDFAVSCSESCLPQLVPKATGIGIDSEFY